MRTRHGRAPQQRSNLCYGAFLSVISLLFLLREYNFSVHDDFLLLESGKLLAGEEEASCDDIQDFDPRQSRDEANLGSMEKLRAKMTGKLDKFIALGNNQRPLYIDVGMNDAKDTGLYIDKGYSVASVDAFPTWIDRAIEKFPVALDTGQLLLFNVGLATEESASLPLYYKEEGSVIASLDPLKGCQGIGNPTTSTKCLHTMVPVVRCEALLVLLSRRAEIFKIDIEMLHHACVRGLHRIPSSLLPQYVCWEEHDKPFGSSKTALRPVTDMKLILGLTELGYDGVKVVIQGYKAHKYYGLEEGKTGHGSGSGVLSPEEMMHYYVPGSKGAFDTNWRPVATVVQEGLFNAVPGRPTFFFNGRNHYFDICMKLRLDDTLDERRAAAQQPENFPLASYGWM